MAAVSVHSFVAALEKSKLLSGEELAEGRRIAAETSDPRIVARQLIKNGLITRWQAAQLLAGHHGLHLGNYKLLEQMDRGGTNCVYLAEHSQMGRRVVLKTLRRGQSSRAEALERFLSEARAIATLDHRNLVHVFDFDSERDRYYLVMEYVEGRDVQRMVEEDGPLPFVKAADYIAQAAEGLDHAHASGLIHGELRPANLWVDEKGTVKIRNLGVARLTENQPSQAESNNVNGQSAFLAPEQTSASGEYDHRADIYALGCTLYCMLTGKPPAARGGDRNGKSPAKSDLRSQRPGIPQPLAAICERMMSADSAQRFQSHQEIVSALRDWKASYRLPAAAPRKRKPAASPAVVPRPAVKRPRDSTPDFAGIAVDTKRPGSRLTKTTKGPSRSEATASSEAPRKSKTLPLAIAGAVGGGMVLIGIVAAVVILSSSGDEPAAGEVSPGAAADGTANVNRARDTDDQSAGSTTKSGDERESSLAAAVSVATPPELVTSPPGGGAPKPPPQPDKVDPAPGQPAGDVEKPQEPKVATEPPQPQNEPAANKPPETQPPAAPPKKEEPKNGPPKNEKPRNQRPSKPPSGPPSPFRNVAAAIDLPPVPSPDEKATEPFVLGKINVGPDAICYIELLGGDKAYKGDQTFSMRRGDSGLAERDWEALRHAGPADETPGQVIATLALRGKDLLFQWTKESQASKASNHLRNCLLALRTGSSSHVVRLRKPVQADALLVDLEKGQVRAQLDVPYPPDPEGVRVEITKLEGAFPNATYKPGQTFEAQRGAVMILVGEPASQPLLFKVESTLTTKLQLGMTSMFSVPVGSPPQRLSKRTAQTLEKNVQLVQSRKEVLMNGLKTLKDKNAVKQLRLSDKEVQRQIAFGEQQVSEIENGLTQIQQLQEYCKAVNAQGRIHFRVFYTVDSKKIDLVRTSAVAPPAPEPKSKA